MIGSNRYIISLILLLTSIVGKTQINKFEVAGVYGYHFATNTIYKTGASLNGPIKGIELGIGKNGIGNANYQEIYGAQKAILNFRFIELNNKDTFGYAFSLLPSIHLPLSISKNQALRVKVSYGLTFNTQQFNKETNFDNRAISSPLNFGLDLGIDWELRIAKRHYLYLSPGIFHISNGSFKMPNGGINLVYLKAGFGLNQGLANSDLKKHSYRLDKKSWNYWIYGFATHREFNYFANLDRFWVFGLNQNLTYQINHLYAIGLGADLHYDATQSLTNADGKRVYQIKEHEKYLFAIGLSQQFTLGKIFLPLGVYTYLVPLSFIKEPVYIRFGLGYHFTKHWFVGSFFKGTVNNKGQLKSDFMEWSFGYRF